MIKIDHSDLAGKLGIHFKDIRFLQEAMTHRSFLNEHKDYKFNHNERLEFLGDAVLELVVTEYLYKNYKNPEGELTNWRAALVNGEMLSKIGKKLEIEEYLLMSRGERKDTGKARQYLLANAIEAIIGAIYLDSGYEAAKQFIDKCVIVNLPEIIETKSYLDPKSYFQEKAQEHAQITPHYKVIKEWGQDHNRRFLVGVFLGNEKIAEEEGTSKQEAQRAAAAKALKVKKWE
ncbi:MAG: ribonuclease III [Patescibacteria group bacterium]|nr:ribonuclease III [Patescibacteria group bacterium]